MATENASPVVAAPNDTQLSANVQDLDDGVPVTLDNILWNLLCPPASLRDLMGYLQLQGAESNLQLLLAVAHYERIFEDAPADTTIRAPEWTNEDASRARRVYQRGLSLRLSSPAISVNDLVLEPSESSSSPLVRVRFNLSAIDTKSEANRAVRDNLPFKEIVVMIIHTFCLANGPQALNLASRDVEALLMAVDATTHPSVFNNIKAVAMADIRHNNMPSFLKYIKANAIPERQVFAQVLGVVVFFGGVIALILLTLSAASRYFRILALLILIPGFSIAFLGFRGNCILLHATKKYQSRPWELYSNDDVERAIINPLDHGATKVIEMQWVAKHAKATWLRKVFASEKVVTRRYIRQSQLHEFWISLIIASFTGAILVVVISVVVEPQHKI